MFARATEVEVNMNVLERLDAVIAWLGRFPAVILQFAFRLSIASVFWHSGMTKIANWDTTIALFRDEYMVPVLPPGLAATMAATVELSCPVLLVLGLATRLATLPMLGMTFVIEVFVYPEQWIEHLMWAVDPALHPDARTGPALARPHHLALALRLQRRLTWMPRPGALSRRSPAARSANGRWSRLEQARTASIGW